MLRQRVACLELRLSYVMGEFECLGRIGSLSLQLRLRWCLCLRKGALILKLMASLNQPLARSTACLFANDLPTGSDQSLNRCCEVLLKAKHAVGLFFQAFYAFLNANLPIGDLPRANQEIGVPRLRITFSEAHSIFRQKTRCLPNFQSLLPPELMRYAVGQQITTPTPVVLEFGNAQGDAPNVIETS